MKRPEKIEGVNLILRGKAFLAERTAIAKALEVRLCLRPEEKPGGQNSQNNVY